MSGKSMSLKAKIRNLASKKDLSAQVVLQNYMFERFLERLSKSEYKDRWIEYTRNYRYAENISYEDVMNSLEN